MKYLAVTLLLALSIACGNAAKPVAVGANNAAPAANAEKPQTAIGHSSENQTPNQPAAGGEKSKWTQGGDPVDTTQLDAAISSAEKTLSTKPTDAAAKKALSAAYLKRAVTLTEKGQYASALGDYRRTLKYDPDNAEAKEWVDRIVSIYDSINRTSPKEGEEPPPLPYTKGKP